jgi:hypothetical protein
MLSSLARIRGRQLLSLPMSNQWETYGLGSFRCGWRGRNPGWVMTVELY